MKKTVIVLVIFSFLFGCFGESEKDKLAREGKQQTACELVQQSKSVAETMTTLYYLESMIAISKAAGNRIDIEGWNAYKVGDMYDVYFYVVENGERQAFHWTIKKNGLLEGLDATTRKITQNQKINVSKIF